MEMEMEIEKPRLMAFARARMITDATTKAHQIVCMTSKDLIEFRGEKEVDCIVESIKWWFDENGKDAYAVIGISGGKDSTIAAALCAKALGPDRVYGVLLPNRENDADFNDVLGVCEYLKIKSIVIPIRRVYDVLRHNVIKYTNSKIVDSNGVVINNGASDFYENDSMLQNIPPRIRMTMLYAVAAGLKNGGRVINTSNFSESFIGYCTKYGDTAGDFSPLGMYTATEVVAIGDLLGLPEHLVHKAPADGLCGKTDEENLGFSYESLDKFIKEGTSGDEETDKNVEMRFINNIHKMNMSMPVSFRKGGISDYYDDVD